MNRKIFLGIAIAVLVTILGGILWVGPTMVIAPQGEIPAENQIITQVEPLHIELVDISVKEISARVATIKIEFKIINPNPRAVIVQTLDYQLFETVYSESEQIS